MKLDKDQIEQLKKLISYKGYPQVDVQYEILDHVACKVEVLMEKNPKLSLADAFRKVHASFGIFGFSELEESYKGMIEKRLRGYYWEELKSLLTSYRVIYPMLVLLILFKSSTWFEDSKSWIAMMIGFILITFFTIVMRYWRKHKKYKHYASYIASNNLFQYIQFGLMTCTYSYMFVYRQAASHDGVFPMVFQSILLICLCFLFVSIFILPRIVERSVADTEELIQVYGEG
jgi:Ca2+/Na+ antiporter